MTRPPLPPASPGREGAGTCMYWTVTLINPAAIVFGGLALFSFIFKSVYLESGEDRERQAPRVGTEPDAALHLMNHKIVT